MKGYYNLLYLYNYITKRGNKSHLRTIREKNYRNWRKFKRHIKEQCLIFLPKTRLYNFRLKSLNRILRTCRDREDFVRTELIVIFNNNRQRFFDIANDCNITYDILISFLKYKKRLPLYLVDNLLDSINTPF